MENNIEDTFYTLIIISIILSIIIHGLIKYDNKITGEKNYCTRVLVEEDYIEKGCDKYFLKENWYQNYIDDVKKDYEKLERGER